MTRAGVSFVAMAAAGITAGVLGYGVIWSYGDPEAPPAAVSAPAPHEPQPPASTPKSVQNTPAVTEAVPPAEADRLRIGGKQEAAAKTETAAVSSARIAEATPPPGSPIEKPSAASAPKEAQTAARSLPLPTAPKAEPPAAAAAAPLPRESVAVTPPSAPAAKPIDSPATRAPVRKEMAAELVPPEEASPKQPRSAALVQSDGRTAIATLPPASPPLETPSVAAPPSGAGVAPPAERPEGSRAPPKKVERAPKRHPRMAALPQKAFDDPQVTIIRGNRRPAATHRAPATERQKVAALPPGAAATRTVTDAPPILVLRGARRPHYALVSAPQRASAPLLTIIRGARPRPVLLQQYVQPNALILHIRQ